MSKIKNILWPVFTLIIFAIALFFNYTAAGGLVSDLDVGEVSDLYSLQITPSGWVFSIWGFIYIWQFSWICYVLYLTCKYEMDTVVFGKWFYFFYNLGNVFNAIWIVVWVNELIVWACLSLLAITLCLISAAFIAHKFLYSLHDTIVDTNFGSAGATDHDPLRWIKQTTGIKPALYGLVANGIPFYATWCVVASHINIGIVLQYEIGLSDDTASIVVLSILSCVILFYWFLDFYKLRLQLRYTYSPYIVLIWAFTGSLTNGGVNVDERASSPFIAALLIVAVLGTIAKVVMGISMRNQPSESPAAETDTLEQV